VEGSKQSHYCGTWNGASIALYEVKLLQLARMKLNRDFEAVTPLNRGPNLSCK